MSSTPTVEALVIDFFVKCYHTYMSSDPDITVADCAIEYLKTPFGKSLLDQLRKGWGMRDESGKVGINEGVGKFSEIEKVIEDIVSNLEVNISMAKWSDFPVQSFRDWKKSYIEEVVKPYYRKQVSSFPEIPVPASSENKIINKEGEK